MEKFDLMKIQTFEMFILKNNWKPDFENIFSFFTNLDDIHLYISHKAYA